MARRKKFAREFCVRTGVAQEGLASGGVCAARDEVRPGSVERGDLLPEFRMRSGIRLRLEAMEFERARAPKLIEKVRESLWVPMRITGTGG
jgi:hypothetical protein